MVLESQLHCLSSLGTSFRSVERSVCDGCWVPWDQPWAESRHLPKGFFSPNRIVSQELTVLPFLRSFWPSWREMNLFGNLERHHLRSSWTEFFVPCRLNLPCLWSGRPLHGAWTHQKPGRKTAGWALSPSFSASLSGPALWEALDTVFQPGLCPWGTVERHESRVDARTFITCCSKRGKRESHFSDCCLWMYWELFLDLKYCPVPFCKPYSVVHTGKANPEFLPSWSLIWLQMINTKIKLHLGSDTSWGRQHLGWTFGDVGV